MTELFSKEVPVEPMSSDKKRHRLTIRPFENIRSMTDYLKTMMICARKFSTNHF